MKKILVTFNNFDKNCREAAETLQEHSFQFAFSPHSRAFLTHEELCGAIGDADAVIAGLGRFDDAVLDCAPKLKVIARCGVGLDGLDLEAARRRGIIVVNTRGSNALAVAEQALGLGVAEQCWLRKFWMFFGKLLRTG